jgi:hypothetical protein
MKITKQRLKEIIKEETSSLMTEAEARLFKFRDKEMGGFSTPDRPSVIEIVAARTIEALYELKEQYGLTDDQVRRRFEVIGDPDGVPMGKPHKPYSSGVTP